ncbi:hypothetical protein AAY473_020447 [Plecturocebus cupreus]
MRAIRTLESGPETDPNPTMTHIIVDNDEGLEDTGELGCSGMISAHCSLCLLGSSNSPASTSRVARIIDMHHHTRLIFVVLIETEFWHFGQAGLELLTSSDQLTSAFPCAGITSVSHHAQPPNQFIFKGTVKGRKGEREIGIWVKGPLPTPWQVLPALNSSVWNEHYRNRDNV